MISQKQWKKKEQKKYYYKNRKSILMQTKKKYHKEREKSLKKLKIKNTKNRKKKYLKRLLDMGCYWCEFAEWSSNTLNIKLIRQYCREHEKYNIHLKDFEKHKEKFNKSLIIINS